MTARSILIIGNWKMHGELQVSQQFAQVWKAVLPLPEVAISIACPTLYVDRLKHLLQHTPLIISAQDVSRFTGSGAYTGEVSATMLKQFGVHYVLIGHSERRSYFHEDDACLADKLRSAEEAGLMPIFCVGESLIERQNGQTQKTIEKQLRPLCEVMNSAMSLIVAYEPIWSIGTGQLANSDQISEVNGWIRNFILQNLKGTVSIKTLYGGSVTPDNAQAILATNGVDGVLVGGASLDPKTFLRIYEIAERLTATWKSSVH